MATHVLLGRRDGSDNSGWWIGDSIGTTGPCELVWAHAFDDSVLPPVQGWRKQSFGCIWNVLFAMSAREGADFSCS